MNKKFNKFLVVFSKTITPLDETKSMVRCRIFYKGANHNGSFITTEFANKLVGTLAYTPVKGIFDEETGDYTTHGKERSEGRIYGIVPENPNFAWEKHLDPDGVERVYACVDVILFTGIYGDEAQAILGKAQSMELYRPSIEGHFAVIGGEEYFVYDNASFLGLQALGTNVEPCFEGAAFFSKNEDDKVRELLMKSCLKTQSLDACYQKKGGNSMDKEKLKDVVEGKTTTAPDEEKSEGAEVFEKEEKVEGDTKVEPTEKEDKAEKVETEFKKVETEPVEKQKAEPAEEQGTQGAHETVEKTGEGEGEFALSDRDKHVLLYDALNEAGHDWYIIDTYDDYAVAEDGENKKYRVYFVKDDDNETLKITNIEECRIVDVNQAEYDALKTIRALNGNSYEHIDEVFTKFSKETDEKDSKINGLNEQLSTLRVERDKFSKELDAANSKLEELNSYKEGIENAKKEEIFSKFSTHLSEETLNKYKEKSKDYSVEQLEKELAYEFCLSTPSLFSDDPLENGFVPKDEQPATGIEAILRKNSEK